MLLKMASYRYPVLFVSHGRHNNGREQVLFVRFMNEWQYRWALISKQVSVFVPHMHANQNHFKVFLNVKQLSFPLLSKINGLWIKRMV